MGYLKFCLNRPNFLVPYAFKKIFTKNPISFFELKVKKFHNESVKNESVRGKIN